MRRTPLRRKPPRDPVTPDVRAAVMGRDGGCVLAGLDLTHQCRDQWGNPHSPTDLSRMTLEHVKDELRMGVRAASDPMHLVVMCWSANDRVPTKAQRVAIREYLASFTNNDCGHIDPRWDCDICQARKVPA